ncbi:MAG: hypothetical protein IT424_06860 [Pirellulales bacterium]|nr:hypothetical protein [Pirellulales bacterium]
MTDRIRQSTSRRRLARVRPMPLGDRRLHIESLEPRLALSVTLLHETFDDDPVNGQPNTADILINAAGPEAYIQVAGPGGAYGTPFGPAGNKSLVIDNPGQAQPAIAWTTEFSDDATEFQTGTVSFDLLLPEPSSGDSWTYIDIRLGYGPAGRGVPTTLNDTTIWNSFRVDNDQADVVADNGNGGGSSPISSFTPLHVVYDIDGATRTYTLSINGATINFGGSPSRPWQAGAPGLNTLAFVGAFPHSSSPLVIDNLQVVRDDQSWTPPADEPTDRLEWHQHRGNKRLTGEAHVSDDVLTGAGVLWSHYIASRESWVAAAPGFGNEAVVLPDGNIAMGSAEQQSWGIGGPYFDLAGTGTLTAETTHSLRRIGDFIPGNGVLEKLEGEVFDTTFGQGVVRLSVYQNGSWVQQWQSPVIPTMHGTANLITGDFDNDGQLEVALTPWTTLYTLNMGTGQIEKTATFKPPANESGRPYGWLGAYDLTGDGREELILLGDFQDFIAVMGWDASGNIVKLWEHVFDPRLSDKRTTHRPGAFPVRDVTGDGQLDIATSVYNETGDNRWHVKIFNALTGALIHDLSDQVIDGARDVNGDGDFELFVRQTEGPLLPPNGTLAILDWNGGGFNTLWSQTDAGFVSQPFADFPANVNSVTSTGKLDLLFGPLAPGGPDAFFTQRVVDSAARLVEVDAWQLDGAGGVAALGSARGINLDVRAIRAAAGGAPSVLFSSEFVGVNPSLDGDYDNDADVDGMDFLAWQRSFNQTGDGLPADGDGDGMVDADDLALWHGGFGEANPNALRLSGFVGASPRFSQAGSPPRSSVTVGRLDGPASPPTVVLQGGSETIVALQPQLSGGAVIQWTRSGLGGFQGATQFQGQHENSGVVLADVNGDGDLETLYATQGDAGQARLVAASPDGEPLWQADFDVTGGRRVFNEPGLILWRTGRFTSADHEDVLVQIMRGIGGTGEFHMLSGLTGETLWTRDYGNDPGTFGIQRGAGEAHMPVYDWDGDGLDEFVNFNPDMFYVVDGDGGPNLVQKPVSGMFAGGQNPLYGQPIVADFRNNGTDSILFAGSYAQLGLTDRNGVQVWSTPFVYDNTPGFIQGVGDVDGDGDLDLLSPGHPIAPATYTASRFHAYDAATGGLLWSVALPGRPFAPVGGAFADTPTLSVSGDIDGDGRVESLFAIGDTLYAVGADPGGTSGRIEWSYRPDGGLLGSPVIADGNGDGRAEIIVVSTSGYVYGIGNVASPLRTMTDQQPLGAALLEDDAGFETLANPAAQPTWWIDSPGAGEGFELRHPDAEAQPMATENYWTAPRANWASDVALDQAFEAATGELEDLAETSEPVADDQLWSIEHDWTTASAAGDGPFATF